MKIATADIGGTNTRFALFKKNKFWSKVKFETNKNNYRETLNHIAHLCKLHKIECLALCIPGPADYDKGIVLNTPNLPGWVNKNIKKYLFKHTNLKEIITENDANVMALANHKYYKQKKSDVTQFFTVSTGLGAGLIINDQIYVGKNHLAQEIARAPLGTDEDDSFHLLPYSVELYASGTGIELRYNKLTGEKLNAKKIFALYPNNENAKKIINEGIDSLARTISTSLAFLNPSLVVFGGSVSEHNNWFIEKAIEKAKTYTIKSQYQNVKFAFDPYTDFSAVMGLYCLAKDKFK